MAEFEERLRNILFSHSDCTETSASQSFLLPLWKILSRDDGLLAQSLSPYPADHGIKHVKAVIENLRRLLQGLDFDPPAPRHELEDLLAAAMVHDLGMRHVAQFGADDERAIVARKRHSRLDVIETECKAILSTIGFQPGRVENILHIASAHAVDDEESLKVKLERVSRNVRGTTAWIREMAVHLLRCGDFLDLGINRLKEGVDKIIWEEPQYRHLRKHKTLAEPSIVARQVTLTLSFEARRVICDAEGGNKPQDKLKRLGIYQVTHEAANELLTALSKASRKDWVLEPLPPELFGKTVALSEGLDLFSKQLALAIKHHKGRESNEPFTIDMMGHSLYSRFVRDSESINDTIKEQVGTTGGRLRILLLDPTVENQQMYEVHEAQRTHETKRYPQMHDSSSTGMLDRDVLPLRDPYGGIPRPMRHMGDIYQALEKLDREWKNAEQLFERRSSQIEVRLTKRLLYASIVRFESQMIITPYRQGGLFSRSVAMVLSQESPIFWAYAEEFESVWDDHEETRLYMHHAGEKATYANPLSRLVRDSTIGELKVRAFSYERWLLEKKHRLRSWFNKRLIPPYEIEFQPSNRCQFHCRHCVGRHLARRHNDTELLRSTSPLKLDSVFEWTVHDVRSEKDFKIERVRISGLLGDPLHETARDFTLGLIKEAQRYNVEIVLFTNGRELGGNKKLLEQLTKVDFIHISVDAGEAETFEYIKGKNEFDRVLEGVRDLRSAVQTHNSLTTVGIGYVVTQRNATEIPTAVKKFFDVGVDFVRFRRDINGPEAIGWRTWDEAKMVIDQSRKKYKDVGEIWLTDLPKRHWGAQSETCWAWRYCVTVGPDGLIYPCDHLTESGEDAALGSLRDSNLEDILLNAAIDDRVGGWRPYCRQCPPFNLRTNHFLAQLKVLHEQYKWDSLEGWIDDVLVS